MIFKFLLIYLFLSSQLFGQYVPEGRVDSSKLSVDVKPCTSYSCFVELEEKMKDQKYSVEYKDGKYDIFLVNIESEDELEQVKKKFVKVFPKIENKKPKVFTKQYIEKIEKKKEEIEKKKKEKEQPKEQNRIEKKELSSEEKNKIIIEKYTKALTHYKQKQYQSSYDQFNQLFANNLNDVNINFYLGRSAYELKKYNEAVLAFDRVLFENPDAARVNLEIARAYMKLNQLKDAKVYFEKTLEDPKVPKQIQEAVKKFLIVIDNNTQKHFLNGVLLLGFNYDSNVNTSSTHDFFTDDPILDILENMGVEDPTSSNNTKKDGTAAHQEVVMLNHKYIYSEKTNIKNGLMAFAKNMFEDKYKSKNIKMFSYTPSLSVTYENGLSVDYAIFTDSLYIDEESILKTYGIMPKVNFPYSKNLIYTGYLKYQIKKNQKSTDKEKDSTYTELNGGIKYVVNKKVTTQATMVLGYEKKDDGARVDVDKNTKNLKLNTTYMFNKNISLAPSFSYKNTQYQDKDTQYQKQIKNNEYKLGLVNTFIYSPKWIYQLSGDQTKQTSNVMKNEYEKYTVTFNIIRTF
ncbi:MAG: tetratricopeptide repeat protein [Campylobacterota bacterium]|nr:tetratricopeptide repeat protein [Campylobacterota bacterium]